MTLEEHFTAGKYADFILINDEVFIIPPGYTLSKTPKEKKNTVIMADGHTREDLIRRWTKFSFSYETTTGAAFKQLQAMVDAAPGVSKRLYLRKETPESSTDYDTAEIDVMSPLKTKYSSRGTIFIHTGVTLEME
jgi:hypothetical protein